MALLYSFAIQLYTFGIRVAALFLPKAQKWVAGRHDWRKRYQATFQKKGRVLWVHAASLGEFEQGRSVIEAFRTQFPDWQIVLTFFSPSGYEVRQHYPQADFVAYLPADTHRNAADFLDIIQPDAVVFVKYEFWFHYLAALRQRGIPAILISALFRPSQPFFQPWGEFWRRGLTAFTHFFLQNQESAQLLQSIGFQNVTVAGDNRIDRVLQLAAGVGENEVVGGFVRGEMRFGASVELAPPNPPVKGGDEIVGKETTHLLPKKDSIEPLQISSIPTEKPGVRASPPVELAPPTPPVKGGDEIVGKGNTHLLSGKDSIELLQISFIPTEKPGVRASPPVELAPPSPPVKGGDEMERKDAISPFIENITDVPHIVSPLAAEWVPSPPFTGGPGGATSTGGDEMERKDAISPFIENITDVPHIVSPLAAEWVPSPPFTGGLGGANPTGRSGGANPTGAIFIAGSTWEADEALFLPILLAKNDWKLIIAPHEPSENNVQRLSQYPPSIRYSQATPETLHSARLLVIDNVGMLNTLYQYGTVAYIGGGFGAGIHNTLEPAAFGLPIIFGPKYTRFAEARAFVERGAAFPVHNSEELAAVLHHLADPENYRQAAKAARHFLEENRGATAKVLSFLDNTLAKI